MTRRLVRGTLAAGVLILTWFTLGQIQAMTAAAPYLAVGTALLLLLVLRAVTVSSRRSSRG